MFLGVHLAWQPSREADTGFGWGINRSVEFLFWSPMLGQPKVQMRPAILERSLRIVLMKQWNVCGTESGSLKHMPVPHCCALCNENDDIICCQATSDANNTKSVSHAESARTDQIVATHVENRRITSFCAVGTKTDTTIRASVVALCGPTTTRGSRRDNN